MKIVITRVGDCLIADGVNLFIYELSDALIRLGHEVYLISGVAENVPIQGKEWRFRNAIKELFSVEEVPKLTSLSDHLHTWSSPLFSLFEENLLFAYKGSRTAKKISPDMAIFNGVTTMRCPYFKVAVATDMQFRVGILKYYDSIMYRTFDKTVAVSTELKQELVRQLQLPVEKIPVIPVCIDTRRFSPSLGAKRIHAILHIGARQEKRPDITIEAFERIAEQDDEVELWITGGLASIGTNERAKTLLSRLEKKNIDIRKRISIMGTVSKEKLAELYSMAKVTSVPSDYVVPVCSPTVIESLASGTPVVGSVSAISKDILIDGYDGFRVQTGDVATFALRLSSMISSDSVWSEMSKNAVTIAQRCDKMNVAKEYISLYKSHLNNK